MPFNPETTMISRLSAVWSGGSLSMFGGVEVEMPLQAYFE